MNLPELFDYHLHTKLCRHAVGEMHEYVLQAERSQLKEIGFADHIPIYFPLPAGADSGDNAMFPDELPYYVDEVLSLRDEFPGLNIKLGLEADYIPGYEEQLQAILSAYPFDYILGSVHFLDGWAFDNLQFRTEYDKWDAESLFARYFSVLQQAIQSGLFDILAHPDLIKKFGLYSSQVRKGDQTAAWLTDIYRQTVRDIKQADICLEINTSGLYCPVAEMYPAPEMLRIAADLDIPVTFGSDAHRPQHVGRSIEQAAVLARTCGIKHFATFSRRRRTVHILRHQNPSCAE